jgi:hypothetical protein
VHLRNCERCVEHERRLAQARERLVRAFIESHPESAAGPAERPRTTELRVVETAVAEEPPAETPEPEPEDPPIERTVAPAEPADATPSEDDAESADPLVPPDEETAARRSPTTIVWNGLMVISIGLAGFALIVTLLALAGVQRIF